VHGGGCRRAARLRRGVQCLIVLLS
jgi:hypothetical protein